MSKCKLSDYVDTKKMLNKALSAFPTLTTERLTLRQPLESDVQEIFLLRSDTTINKYLDRQPSKTVEEALNFIRKVNENIQKNESLYWVIVQTDNEKLVGTICLSDFLDELNRCEIGYELLTNYQGQGLMSEAINKIIELAIHTLGLREIDAFTHKDNKNSTKLLEKFNFKDTKVIDGINSNLLLFRLSS